MIYDEVLKFTALKIVDHCRPDAPMELIQRLTPFVREQLQKLLDLDRRPRAEGEIRNDAIEKVAQAVKASKLGGPGSCGECGEVSKEQHATEILKHKI